MQEKYAHKVDFLCVYIEEAHAQDEWPISSCRWNPTGKKIMYNQHKTIEDRLAVARDFIDAFGWKYPTILDAIDNPFETAYAAWPLRLYVVKDGRMVFKAQPREAMYHLQDVMDVLDTF